MKNKDIERLRRLTRFEDLVAYLRDELDWPIEVEDADDITFDYEPAELGIAPQHAVKIETIKQIRPLVETQPWGVFYVQFESKRLPVVVLRRILRSLVPKSRQSDPDRPVWRMSDLLFISAQGEPGYRSISFAHFHRRERAAQSHRVAQLRCVASLRTFSWDVRETHLFYIKNLNLEALRWPEDEEDPDAWREQWRRAFTVEHRYTVRTSQKLAREMARHAATVRDMVNEVYALESDEGPLHALYASFKEALLHDLTPEAFADMVAQTVAYGLFSAATQTGDSPAARLGFDTVVEQIPNTNPFLKDLLAELTTAGAVDLEELGVGQLVELLRQTDVEAILQDFGRQTGGGREDPVLHFYEDFLNAYDKEQRVQRGVFYTPDPVVSYIVRSVDYLLRTEFGLENGLADTSVDPETDEPLVQILDPATGTGTFLAHVIDVIEETVKEKRAGSSDWSAYVAEHLLPRLNGFELMMAPYAVAHMKLGLKLRQTGYDFSGGGEKARLRVFLTNTLEEPVESHEALALAGFLSKESNAAARVKRRTPITVVVGNPPYAGHSANESAWIAGLLRGSDDQGRDVENYFAVDGHGINERQPKWLNDDYVKFIRFGQWRINQTGAGILAFITNHGYLDNPTFRGMRQSLMTDFDTIYVLDLHGSTKKRESTPEGKIDENVFDILPGVAILVAIKSPMQSSSSSRNATKVYHSDLWGLREEKYTELIELDLSGTNWEQLSPISPFYLFVPCDANLLDEYQQGWKITEAFSENSVGIVTARDAFTVHWTRDGIWNTVCDFVNLPVEEAREKYALGKDSQSWHVRRAQEDIQSSGVKEDRITSITYRPFDSRFTYYTGRSNGFMARPIRDTMHHMLSGPNLGLIAARGLEVERPYDQFLSTRSIIQHHTLSIKEVNYLIPLYLHPDPSNATLFDSQEPTDAPGGRIPNLAPEFITDLSDRLGLRFIPDGRGDLSQTFGPEDVLHYAYAIFHSPTYRERYTEFLKIDFPRLPLTSDVGLFRALTGLGADLVALHLLEDDYPAASWTQAGELSPLQQPVTTFVERETGTKMGKFSKRTCYDPESGRVYLDTSQRGKSSYFDGVPEDVWAFQVGGYQVLHKWLYDRRETPSQPGRVLTQDDVDHYQRIVVALKETMRLMAKIDEVIESHGGWPIE